MNQVQIQPAPSNVDRTGTAVRIVVVGVLVAASLALAIRIVDGPRFVGRVTIANESAVPLDVDVADAEQGSWTPEGVALQGGATTFEEVVDQGDVWWFRFSSAGRSVVVRVPRAQLARDGWRLTVPKSIRETLVADGKRLD